MPQWARPDPIVTEGVIEDEAVQAVKDMSNYLMSLNTIGITSIGSLDVVTNDGQRIQLDGTTTYKVRKPGFVIDYVATKRAGASSTTARISRSTRRCLAFMPRRRRLAQIVKCWTPSTTSSA